MDLFNFFSKETYSIYLSVTILLLIFSVPATHVDNVGLTYIYREREIALISSL